jgi:hypothetical protein
MERKPVEPVRKKGALGKYGVPLADRRKAFRLARDLGGKKKQPSKKQLEILSQGLSTKQIAQMNSAAFNKLMAQAALRDELARVAAERRRRPEV